jgi:hypothetical protein
MKIKLKIGKEIYNEIKSKKICVKDYMCKIEIAGREYDCLYNNEGIIADSFVSGRITLNEIEVLHKFTKEDSELLNMLNLSKTVDICICGEEIGHCASFTVKRNCTSTGREVYVDNLKFIEY